MIANPINMMIKKIKIKGWLTIGKGNGNGVAVGYRVDVGYGVEVGSGVYVA